MISVGVKRFIVHHFFLEDILNDASFEMVRYENQNDPKFWTYLNSQVYKFDNAGLPTNQSSGNRQIKNIVKPGIDDFGFILGVELALCFHGIYLKSDNIEYQNQPGTCVMVFLPGTFLFNQGENEILEWMDAFEQRIPQSHVCREFIKVIVLHSQVPPIDQQQAFEEADHGTLKIVLCTNIAESSITIADASFVLDYGLRRSMEYNLVRKIQQLTLGWISRASATQRLGRCGRCQPGVCVALYTRKFTSTFRDHDIPEIAQISLEGLVLRVKDIFPEEGVRELLNQLVEPPESSQLNDAFANLRLSGAISGQDEDGQVTFFGRLAGPMPCDLIQSRVMLFACSFGYPSEGSFY